MRNGIEIMAGMREVLAAGVCALLLFFSGCVSVNEEQVKEEALDFSLEIVGTYLTGDVDRFCSFFTDPLYTLEDEGPFSRSEVIRDLKARTPFPAGYDYSGYTMEDYLEVYEPRVLEFDEYMKEYPGLETLEVGGWSPGEDDFLFVGSKTRPGREGFLWDDLLIFMVTDRSGEWELIALSG